MKKRISVAQRAITVIASSKFFWGIVVLLAAQSLWIAISGRYPMAFDEDFHLGIIRIYAQHLSPFLTTQPAGADVYGAVTRDPSYLYQYLMSFPYRLISLFTTDQTIQVILLRCLNILILASSLPLYRKLLAKTGASRALANVCLLIFVLLPVVPFMAAQINYDSLLLVVFALSLLIAVNISDALRSDRPAPLPLLSGLLMICLLGSLVKYAFLPVFFVVFLYLLVRFKQIFGSWRQVLKSLSAGLAVLSRRLRMVLVVGIVVSTGLFMQRYGVNLIRYHNPIPNCGKVLSVQQCSAYGPWIRDYNFSINKVDGDAHKSPLTFTADWAYGMWLRIFFAIGGPDTDFQSRGPLPIPAVSAIIFAGISAVAVVVFGRRLFRAYHGPVLGLFAGVVIVYVGALWLDEYRAFLRTGQPVAINGRYLVPVILLLFVLAGLAVSQAVKRFPKRAEVSLIIASLAILSLVWGGGGLTYIIRSNDNWYWPNPTIRAANHAIQRLVDPITPGANNPAEYLH